MSRILRPVKTEPVSPPSKRGRIAGAIVIREGHALSPPHGRKRKPKREAAAAIDHAAEEAAILEAIARSLNDLVPADNTMPMDEALAWCRQEREREEAERSDGCWRRLSRGAAHQSSSWRTAAMTNGTGRRRLRHASTTLARVLAVGETPVRAAAKRCRPRHPSTTTTTTLTTARTMTATTRRSTAIFGM
jgi:hypothetical protein